MGEGNPSGSVIPISYESTESIETGKWSSLKPQSTAMTAPCREACPAGNNIALFVHLISKGRYKEALSAILIENPFPAVCGRVCFHPCEKACNRAQFDESVSVQMLERFVAEISGQPPEPVRLPADRSRRVAVIGAGPAGLACAYYLALLGHQPTIFESRDEPGGVMRWGIPEFRLPKRILKKEIKRILALPIELQTNCRIGRDLAFDELDWFDAVFLSPGAELSTPMSIEGENLAGVWKGGEFLSAIGSGRDVSIGKETLVIGGGNTAIDVARSGLRIGSKVTIAYRRTRDAMPAIADEIAEAEEEGVHFRFLIQPLSVQKNKDGRLDVVFQVMKPGNADESGRVTAIPVSGEFVTIQADTIVTAVGEMVDVSWIPGEMISGNIIEPAGYPGVFAGGDASQQPRTIVNAIASAKSAAISMDLYFRGDAGGDIFSSIQAGRKGSLSFGRYISGRGNGVWAEKTGVVDHEKINTLYFEKSQRVKDRRLTREKRLAGFSEVNLNPGVKNALLSASRCYSCGTCNACLNCYYFCPEGAISVDSEQCTRSIDYLHCKGCGTCAKACPRNAVEMKDRP